MNTRKKIDHEIRNATTVYTVRGARLNDNECAIVIDNIKRAAALEPEYRAQDIAKILQHAYYYRALCNFKEGGNIDQGAHFAKKYLDTNPSSKFRNQIENLLKDYSGDRVRELAHAEKLLAGNTLDDKGRTMRLEIIKQGILTALKIDCNAIIKCWNDRELDTALMKAKFFLAQFPKGYDKSHPDYQHECYKYYSNIKKLLLDIHIKRTELSVIPAYKTYHSLSAPKPRTLKPTSVIRSMTNMTFGKRPPARVSASEHVIKKPTQRKK